MSLEHDFKGRCERVGLNEKKRRVKMATTGRCENQIKQLLSKSN